MNEAACECPGPPASPRNGTASQVSPPPFLGSAASDSGPSGVAMDLHDFDIQRLFAAGLSLETLREHVPPGHSTDRFDGVVADLDATIAELRAVIAELKHSSPAAVSLHAGILSITAGAARSLGFTPHVSPRDPGLDHVSTGLARDVLAVLSEALSNAARHADASEVWVHVTAFDGGVRVSVTDNGSGMGDTSRRSGLSNLQVRASRRAGTFAVDSDPDSGTVLLWTAPLHATR